MDVDENKNDGKETIHEKWLRKHVKMVNLALDSLIKHFEEDSRSASARAKQNLFIGLDLHRILIEIASVLCSMMMNSLKNEPISKQGTKKQCSSRNIFEIDTEPKSAK